MHFLKYPTIYLSVSKKRNRAWNNHED